jgi:hypothetical protein
MDTVGKPPEMRCQYQLVAGRDHQLSKKGLPIEVFAVYFWLIGACNNFGVYSLSTVVRPVAGYEIQGLDRSRITSCRCIRCGGEHSSMPELSYEYYTSLMSCVSELQLQALVARLEKAMHT